MLDTLTLPVAAVRDARLSPESRAVLALGLSFAEDALPDPFPRYLADQGIGSHRIGRVLAELCALGYLERRRTTRSKWTYRFSATPSVPAAAA